MATYYETQERALAPGIADGWPDVIPAPHTKHGRLVKLDYDPVEESSKLKALLRQMAGRILHSWNMGRAVDDRLARYAKQAKKLAAE